MCLLLAISSLLFGVKPIIFRSGSMAPAMPTGSLGIAHQVPAADLAVGDVVTVPYNGTHVTHRIVEVTQGNEAATLRLKGDANKSADAVAYRVTSAARSGSRCRGSAAPSPGCRARPGSIVLGLYVALLLALLMRPRAGRPVLHVAADGPPPNVPGPASLRVQVAAGKRRLTRTAVLVAALTAVATPAWAAPWTDSVPVNGTSSRPTSYPSRRSRPVPVTGDSVTSRPPRRLDRPVSPPGTATRDELHRDHT